MKKTLSALTIGLLSTGVFFNIENVHNPIENNNSTYEIKSTDTGGVYLLSAGEDIGQTNDQKFDDYWTEISSKDSKASQLFILEGVTKGNDKFGEENYVLDMTYSWANLEQTNPGSKYEIKLDFTNDKGENIITYNLGIDLDPQSNYGIMEIQPEIPVSEIESGNQIYMNTTLKEDVAGGYEYKNSGGLIPSIDIEDYVTGFGIGGFAILEDSILPNEFQFHVKITPRDGSTFDPRTNTLILYANKVPLNTTLVETNKNTRAYQYTYKVTNLEENQVYENWAIGISGFDNIENVSYRAIRTSRTNPNKPAVISGITIGVILLILLIILIILVALKSRKKVVENNVYNEYRSFLDENGNVVRIT